MWTNASCRLKFGKVRHPPLHLLDCLESHTKNGDTNWFCFSSQLGSENAGGCACTLDCVHVYSAWDIGVEKRRVWDIEYNLFGDGSQMTFIRMDQPDFYLGLSSFRQCHMTVWLVRNFPLTILRTNRLRNSTHTSFAGRSPIYTKNFDLNIEKLIVSSTAGKPWRFWWVTIYYFCISWLGSTSRAVLGHGILKLQVPKQSNRNARQVESFGKEITWKVGSVVRRAAPSFLWFIPKPRPVVQIM